jgi:hypothetical protein
MEQMGHLPQSVGEAQWPHRAEVPYLVPRFARRVLDDGRG